MSSAATRRRRRSLQAVTMADVARHARVSGMTVSRVLAGAPGVSAATATRVRRAMAALDYRPNAAARHLAGGGGGRVGLVYVNPSQAYLSELLVGALTAAEAIGCQLVLARAGSLAARLDELAALARAGVDGFILPPSVCDEPRILRALERGSARWVALSPADEARHALAISADDRSAAREMTAHLLAAGHRRIAFIVGDPSIRAAIDRREGYLDAMREASARPGPLVQGDFSFQSGVRAAEVLLAGTPACTAIFAANDDMAVGAMSVAHRRGLELPRDLSIAGFDDTPVAATVWPGVTTMRQPIAAMAEAALRLLAVSGKGGAARGKPAPHQVFHCTLVERQSCAPPRGAARAPLSGPGAA